MGFQHKKNDVYYVHQSGMLCNKLYAYQLGQLCRGTARDRLIAQGKDGAKIFPLSLVGVLSPTRRARDLSLVGVLSPTRKARGLASAQLTACCRSYHRTTVLGLTLDSVLRFAGGLEAILVTHFLSHFCLVSVTSMLATTGLWWCYLHALRRGLIDVCQTLY